MKNLIYFTAIFILLNSCATTPTVTRIDVSEQIDLSGEWNDTDSQLVAAEMIKDALARPWIDEFIS
ncbi:MAG: penicillin-binding protein activator LpoB, partial [Endomicrobia bacterium]|nr:penicillin-binding protein activator LpoB [Endomicrobiia bacterium]